MVTVAPEQTKAPYGQVRVGQEIANPLGWVLARNKRLADMLEAMPEGGDAVAKVLRGIDYYCRRNGLATLEQKRRLRVDASYIDATDCIVVRVSH